MNGHDLKRVDLLGNPHNAQLSRQRGASPGCNHEGCQDGTEFKNERQADHRAERCLSTETTQRDKALEGKPKQVDKPAKTQKLSYNDQRELGNLPGIIEKLETSKSELEQEMSAPGFYESDFERAQEASQSLVELEKKLEAAFERWGELDG